MEFMFNDRTKFAADEDDPVRAVMHAPTCHHVKEYMAEENPPAVIPRYPAAGVDLLQILHDTAMKRPGGPLDMCQQCLRIKAERQTV